MPPECLPFHHLHHIQTHYKKDQVSGHIQSEVVICLNMATHCGLDFETSISLRVKPLHYRRQRLRGWDSNPCCLRFSLKLPRVIGVMTSDFDVESITLITIFKHTTVHLRISRPPQGPTPLE